MNSTLVKLTSLQPTQSIVDGEIIVGAITFDFFAVISHFRNGFKVLSIDGIDVQDPEKGPISDYSVREIEDAIYEFIVGREGEISVKGEAQGEGASIDIDLLSKDKTLCRKRRELAAQGLNIPIVDIPSGTEHYIGLDEWCYCTQPEEYEDKEFDVVINTGITKFLVNSIDLEFKTEGDDE